MKALKIIEKLNKAQNGSFKSVTTQTEFKNKNGEKFKNTTVLLCQNNINYSNRKNVKDAIARGVRNEPTLRDCYEKITIDGVTLNRHKVSGQLYLPVNYISSKATVTNEAGKVVEKKDLRLMSFDSKNKPSFMKKETTISNLEKKIALAEKNQDLKLLETLEAKMLGYKNPSKVLGQEKHITPKLETVIAIS